MLLIGGGTEAVPGIERVRAMGLRIAVVDGDSEAPGFALADHALVVSTYDIEGVVDAARDLHDATPIHGVMSIACDVPKTVAAVAQELNLPGIPPATAALCMDKRAMKERFLQAGVPVPWFEALHSGDQLAEAIANQGRVIIKPVDSRGSRGVLLVGQEQDPDWAFEQARTASPTGRAMMEQFLDGPQLSTESVVLEGRVYTLGCSDRNYARLHEFTPHVIEDGGCQPTAHLDDVLPSVDSVIARAAQAIGMSRGVLKGDLVLVPGRGPVVIEVAPRLSGGWFCTDQIPVSTGVDLVQMQARIALGETPGANEMTPARWDPIAVRYAFPGTGRLLDIKGIEALAQESWCHRVHVFAQPGSELSSPDNHTGRAAVVLATGATRREAIDRARDGVARLEFNFETQPQARPKTPAA